MESIHTREPWNKGKLIGQKPPLKPKDIWAIRIQLQHAHQVRGLAMFNLAIEEHAEVKRAMDNLAETHDAPARSEKFVALARLVKEHVQEEETQLFPKLDAKRADFGDLGAQLRDRKEGLSRVSLFL